MKRKTSPHQAALTDRTTIKVRFSEIDSMQIVWHGEYVRYFEDGREAFGKRYGLDYMSIYREGYVVPIVDLTCQFKQPLSFGEENERPCRPRPALGLSTVMPPKFFLNTPSTGHRTKTLWQQEPLHRYS